MRGFAVQRRRSPVSFNAEKLNENIYIYLKSAQIRDIPLHCKLVDKNTPASDDELLSEGDTILYGAGTDYAEWPRLSAGRGANTFGSHAADAPSLFFFENMQGQHPDKHQYNNFDRKDNVLYGTYVEVEGYYINRSVDNPSYGAITYRCMLGRNMEDDFDAERNTHYKLTLVFNKDANNPDWHIEYDYVPQPPEIVVASPMYISYLSNQQLTIPLTVYYDKNITKVTKITAEIVGNDWGYSDHPYIHKADNALTNGFLSLDLINKTAVGNRKTEYTGMKTYTVPVSQDDTRYRFDIPVYTRPMTLGRRFLRQQLLRRTPTPCEGSVHRVERRHEADGEDRRGDPVAASGQSQRHLAKGFVRQRVPYHAEEFRLQP